MDLQKQIDEQIAAARASAFSEGAPPGPGAAIEEAYGKAAARLEAALKTFHSLRNCPPI
jgi:hypothetical protein